MKFAKPLQLIALVASAVPSKQSDTSLLNDKQLQGEEKSGYVNVSNVGLRNFVTKYRGFKGLKDGVKAFWSDPMPGINLRRIVPRIIGGEPVETKQFDFTAAIVDRRHGHFCGGSLIAKDCVLTAAHCIDPDGHWKIDDVAIGRHDLRDYWVGQTIHVKYILPHPAYDKTTKDNDFMLLFLSKPVTEGVSLIKLNNDPSTPEVDEEMTITGWGDTNIDIDVTERSDVLMEVEVYAVSNRDCSISGWKDRITENMMCAHNEGKDSCKGDSGGPLFMYQEGEGGGYMQFGVVSFGTTQCAHEDAPAVYARVSAAYDWIESEVCKRSEYATEAGFDCPVKRCEFQVFRTTSVGCGQGEMCALESNNCPGDWGVAPTQTGVCISTKVPCTSEKATVCGCDYKDYDNACMAHQAHTNVRYVGQCRKEKGSECSVNSDCRSYNCSRGWCFWCSPWCQ